MTDFEKEVRKALIDKDMSLTKLADELRISIPYLYEILKGTRKSEEQKTKIKLLLGMGDRNG